MENKGLLLNRQLLIERERTQLVRLAERHGLQHPKVLAQSKRLDRLLVAEQRRRIG